MKFDFPCVILAGGKSSRFGEDKALYQIKENQSLTKYQYDKLSKLFSNVFISSKKDKFDFECKIIIDNNDNYSPMIALKSILESIDSQKVFIIPVDTPNLIDSTIQTLINSSENFDITIAKTNDKTHFLCGVFDKKLLDSINDLLTKNNHKIQNLIGQSKVKIIQFYDEDEFLNINTKEDLKSL
jgi:molybdopterin-guanine dinucleotide biosynthesis protein A